MYIDSQLVLSSAQSIVGNAATAIVSTNTIDRAAATGDVGTGKPVRLFVNVDTTVVGGSGGITIDYIQSANADLSSPDILATVTAAATPAAGTKLVDLVVPANTKRYVGVQYTPLTTNTTAGKLNAYLVLHTQSSYS